MPHDAALQTEEMNRNMAKEMSNAAAERAQAQAALKNGGFAPRDTYTAKQVAARVGTDAKTMRKFFRSAHSTVEPVGQGGRYEFDAADLPKIKREFNAWQKKAKARTPINTPAKIALQEQIKSVSKKASEEGGGEFTPEQIEAALLDQEAQEQAALEKLKEDRMIYPEEPTEDELRELEGIDLDLDELDAEDD